MTTIIDRNIPSLENVLLHGDFNMETNDEEMGNSMNTYNLSSLFKRPTCLKTSNDKSRSFETGFSHHHHLLYTILKSTFAIKHFHVKDF